MPKDYLGRELKLGQLVIHPTKFNNNIGLNLSIGEIRRFTPRMMLVATPGSISERRMYPEASIGMNESDSLRYELGQEPVNGEWVDR